jgi:NAD(P)-dependent dehydrogenase (short-subunit alcohol dehydrogenase family)
VSGSVDAVVIVTGAGGDIGRAIGRALSADRVTIVLADIDIAAVRVAADTLTDCPGKLVPVACDVTDANSVASMAVEARRHGAIFALVNNAGGITAASLNAAQLEDWHADIALNLNAAFTCFKSVAEDLKKNSGCVVNIASVNGLGSFGHPGYSAAKAGLIHLTRSIAVEYGKFGVRANAVAPGTVRTQAWEERARVNPEIFDDMRRWYPLQRIALAEDVANAVAFLTSANAAAITGVCLPVDCGLLAGQTELAGYFSQSGDY